MPLSPSKCQSVLMIYVPVITHLCYTDVTATAVILFNSTVVFHPFLYTPLQRAHRRTGTRAAVTSVTGCLQLQVLHPTSGTPSNFRYNKKFQVQYYVCISGHYSILLVVIVLLNDFKTVQQNSNSLQGHQFR